jgi:hypothetical protein
MKVAAVRGAGPRIRARAHSGTQCQLWRDLKSRA